MSGAPAAASTQESGASVSSRASNAAVLACLTGALLIGLLIRPAEGDSGTVLTLFGLRLPTICWFRISTGIPCAGCGLTRSIVLLLHGSVQASLAAHPFGVVAVALALLQAPPRLARARGRSGSWIGRWDRLWVLATCLTALLMMVWWIARVGVRVLLKAWLW